MSNHVRKSLKSEGFANWLRGQGIDPIRFAYLVDKGQRPAGLMRDFDRSRPVIINYLNQLAFERGLSDWHRLYR